MCVLCAHVCYKDFQIQNDFGPILSGPSPRIPDVWAFPWMIYTDQNFLLALVLIQDDSYELPEALLIY